MNLFELKVKNYINKNDLITNNKVILAFSYGIDSRSMLNVLISLGYEVIIAHVNHKVRKESDIEENETIKLCKSLNIKYYIKHLTLTSKNFESSARKERYSFFEEIALKEKTNILITAHHKDDNLETIFLKLFQGSNLYGYSGIHNKVKKNNLTIVRPFMCVSKKEIKDYQKEKNFIYFEDYTNHEDIQQRNKLRNNIIPILKRNNPSILDKAIDYSNILYSSFEYIRKQSISFYNEWAGKIINSKYLKLDKAVRYDIICYFLEQKNLNKNYNLISSIDNSIQSDKPQVDIKLEGKNYFLKRYEHSYISNLKENKFNQITLNINEKKQFNNQFFYFARQKPIKNENYIKLCYNNLKLPLLIRNRINGDEIKLSFGKKKIKDIFINKKIKKEIRESVAIILNDNEIIWIPEIIKSATILDQKNSGDIYLIQEVNDGKRY